MENRLPMLLVTGALAFGGLGYFLFLYDDGMAVRMSTSTPRTTRTPRPMGTAPSSSGAPGMRGAAPIVTSAPAAEPPAAPAETAPHENPE